MKPKLVTVLSCVAVFILIGVATVVWHMCLFAAQEVPPGRGDYYTEDATQAHRHPHR